MTLSLIEPKFLKSFSWGEATVVEADKPSTDAQQFRSAAERLMPIEHIPVKIVTMREGLVVMADAADQPCWG